LEDAELDGLYFWFWKVRVDEPIVGLVPDNRVLRVLLVGMDEHCVRVRYVIEPPVDHGWVRQYPMLGWLVSGRDDSGTEYVDAGGAIGQSRDGRRTIGTRSLTPLPPAGAKCLDLAFHRIETVPGAPPHHTLRIHIPSW